MSIELAKAAWEAAKDKKAKRLIFLDLRGKSDICDYQIICSGDTDKQTKAICDSIEETCLREVKVKPAAIEGRGSGHWILLDYGGVMVHIFINQLRDYYALESLYPGSIADTPFDHQSDD